MNLVIILLSIALGGIVIGAATSSLGLPFWVSVFAGAVFGAIMGAVVGGGQDA